MDLDTREKGMWELERRVHNRKSRFGCELYGLLDERFPWVMDREQCGLQDGGCG